MSELGGVGFKEVEEADRVLLRLAKLKKEHLVDLEDAAVVIRDEAGRSTSNRALILPLRERRLASFSLPGAYGEGLIGLLFMHPIAGFVLGVQSASG